ncbi:UNVERIFIED_CONTAM: hypothetical protein GTU68_003279 [Idotea baltica]|nr:hypothetical protein [Idotea baltica]
MKIIDTELPEVKIVEPKRYGDERGFFAETFQAERYRSAGVGSNFVQDNHSRSSYGVLRGLHYQIRRPQGKLVSVPRGSVFDVAVDMRSDSPRFGEWTGVVLSEENGRQLYIPPGFAHGFCVISEIADFVYKCTDYYCPEHERSLLWNDPDVGIDWPVESPLVSEKDQAGACLNDAESFESVTLEDALATVDTALTQQRELAVSARRFQVNLLD